MSELKCSKWRFEVDQSLWLLLYLNVSMSLVRFINQPPSEIWIMRVDAARLAKLY